MNTLNKILIALVVLLVVALGLLVYAKKDLWEKPYYAVYLSTGDLYFGQLTGNRLNNVLVLQQTGEDGQQGASIAEFRGAFWGPEGGITLNPAQIVWKARLDKESQIIEFIKRGIPNGTQTPQDFGADFAPPVVPEQPEQ